MEHVYLKYEGSITLERFRMTKDNLASKTMNIADLGEGILQRDILDVNVIDNVTGLVAVSYRGCSASEYSESFRVTDIATESITFLYLTACAATHS